MSNTTTSTGATVDETTGEVTNETPRRRRRVLTDREREERDLVLAERAELRRQELAALRAINPACETEDDRRVPRRHRAPERTIGVAIRRDELREVAKTLTAQADAVDTKGSR